MYTAGPISKPKFPEDHAEWTRKMAQQGYARIAAENAAKAEKQAEKERRIAETRSQERSSTAVDDMSLGPEGRDAVDDGKATTYTNVYDEDGGADECRNWCTEGQEEEEEECFWVSEKGYKGGGSHQMRIRTWGEEMEGFCTLVLCHLSLFK